MEPSVLVRQEQRSLPTHDAQVVDRTGQYDIHLASYPNPRKDRFSDTAEPRDHTVCIVENSCLRLEFLPAYGGRLWRVWDKLAGRDMFTHNPVIRPQDIGTSGAWMAGGVEFNFPISHSPNTHDPVFFELEVDGEGNGVFRFGNEDAITGMRWTVALSLAPDAARIRQTVRIENPSDLSQRGYFWTNAAVPFDPEAFLVYPFDTCHNQLSAEVQRWPSWGGADLRSLKATPYAYETFGKVMTGNSFCAYYPGDAYGVAHVSDREILHGAKYFTWGTEPLADLWNAKLLPQGGEYFEIQSGPFDNQMVYRLIPAHGVLEWEEFWMPVRLDQPLRDASSEVAWSWLPPASGSVVPSVQFWFPRAEGSLEVRFDTPHRQVLRRCEVASAGQTLTLAVHELEGIETSAVRVTLTAGARVLIDSPAATRPCEPTEVADFERVSIPWRTDPSLTVLDLADRCETLGLYAEARAHWEGWIEAHGEDVQVWTALARLALRRLDSREAARAARKALALRTRATEARYLLAVSQARLGNRDEAQRLFQDITLEDPFFPAALTELARSYLQAGRPFDAQRLVSRLSSTVETRLLAELAGIEGSLTPTDRALFATTAVCGGPQDRTGEGALFVAWDGLTLNLRSILARAPADLAAAVILRFLAGERVDEATLDQACRDLRPMDCRWHRPLADLAKGGRGGRCLPLARLLRGHGDLSGAAFWFDQALGSGADHEEAAVERARIDLVQGNRDRATGLLVVWALGHPGPLSAELVRTWALALPDPASSEALISLEAAACRCPETALVADVRADLLLRLDRPEEALEALLAHTLPSREGSEGPVTLYRAILRRLMEKEARETAPDAGRLPSWALALDAFPGTLMTRPSIRRPRAVDRLAQAQAWWAAGQHDRARQAASLGASEAALPGWALDRTQADTEAVEACRRFGQEV